MFRIIFLCSFALAVSSLGINCRGSFYCWDGSNLELIKSYMDGLIDNNRDYNAGEHIVCYTTGVNSFPIYSLIGKQFQEDVVPGFCLFLQDTKGPVKGGKIFELVNHLLEHGCKGCGSVPIDFPASNDPGNGILTMNYVGGTRGCHGLC